MVVGGTQAKAFLNIHFQVGGGRPPQCLSDNESLSIFRLLLPLLRTETLAPLVGIHFHVDKLLQDTIRGERYSRVISKCLFNETTPFDKSDK